MFSVDFLLNKFCSQFSDLDTDVNLFKSSFMTVLDFEIFEYFISLSIIFLHTLKFTDIFNFGA